MFSVLMTIYENDNVKYLQSAIDSLLEQTLVPGEILIVKDGPLRHSTETMLSQYNQKIIRFLQLEKNVGQSMALNYGLKECEFDLVARMDADDISVNTRFEKQFSAFQADPSLDVLGGGIKEFINQISEIEMKERILPLSHDEIVRYSKFRSPINHATVMYRKSKVLEAGNYYDIFSVADYHLWPRMFKNGCRFRNLSENLLFVRAGKDMYSRRGGLNYALQDIKLQIYFLRLNHVNVFQFIFNVIVRTTIGLAPNSLRALFYEKLLRKTIVSARSLK